MKQAVKEDIAFHEKYQGLCRNIIAPLLMTTADRVTKLERVADLIVFEGAGKTAATRIRKAKSTARQDEFTIRASRPSGVRTEYEKMRSGYCDLFLYAKEAVDELGFAHYLVVDLNVWRQQGIVGKLEPNPDGTWFRAFKTKWYPPELVVAHGEERR